MPPLDERTPTVRMAQTVELCDTGLEVTDVAAGKVLLPLSVA